MQIPVLIEAVKGTGYRATSGLPLSMNAEGATPEDALQKLRELLTSRIVAGARLVQMDVSAADNPWLRIAGADLDDPSFEEWQQAVAEYRRERDADPDAP